MTTSLPKVHARAWCRVDFAGGTLDIWPLGLLHRGASTVSVAVDCPVSVSLSSSPTDEFVVAQGTDRVCGAGVEDLQARPETALVGWVAESFEAPPFRCEIHSGSPRGGGLGASSALTVALIRAMELWSGQGPRDDRAVMAMARDVEAALMSLPTGTQDHAAALLGGIVELTYPPGGPEVRRLEGVDLGALGESLVLVYSGQSHFSAGNNWQVVRRRLDGDEETVSCFDGLAETAQRMGSALRAGDLPLAGALMDREWSFRRRLAPGISTPEIESLLALAREEGAWGGKVCGAGGGGCIAVLCPPQIKASLQARYESQGFQVIQARPTGESLKVQRAP